MPVEAVQFTADSLNLEGLLHLPAANRPAPAVVVCHPHPLYGGDMHSLVVARICSALNEKGIAALRFNFRGTGASQGSHTEGSREPEDAKGALSYLASLASVDPDRMGIAGYSFGAFVALSAGIDDERGRAICAVAPPVTFVDMSYITHSTKPKFFVFGSRDEITPLEPFMALYNQLQGENRFAVIDGADHYLARFEGIVAEKVADYFAEKL